MYNDDDPDGSEFVDRFGKVIDDLVDTDVNTREIFAFVTAADEGEQFSVLDTERIVSDLFGLRLRFAMATIAMRAANNLIRPKSSWKNSMKDVRSCITKAKALLSLMGAIDDEQEREDDDADEENGNRSQEEGNE